MLKQDIDMNRVGQLVKWGLVVEKVEPNLIIDGNSWKKTHTTYSKKPMILLNKAF